MIDMSTQYKSSKKYLFLMLLIYLAVFNQAQAEPFSPTLLKLTADPVVCYDFGGSELTIPVTVHGTPACLVFCVFTRGKADKIKETINGYLGWHHVNKVDTCVYVSTMYEFDPGEHVVTWDGKNADGALVPHDQYTYYMWAYDNKSEKQLVCEYIHTSFGFANRSNVQETDKYGLPLYNPIYYEAEKRWEIGNDSLDESLMETTRIPTVQGWERCNRPAIDHYNLNNFFILVSNPVKKLAAIQKYKWISNGEAELQAGFGEKDGYSGFFHSLSVDLPGVLLDGDYLYTCDENHKISDNPDAEFYIYDYSGRLVDEIDLSGWWSSPDDFEQGGQMNGGPTSFFCRHSKVFLSSHYSCINQIIDPIRYIESGNKNDFYIWTNVNGDYFLDRNFEETAQFIWVCNDYNVAPYTFNITSDDNLFSLCPVYVDLFKPVSFGLLAPDGTGLGYFTFSGDKYFNNRGCFYIDSGTPYDGMYCDYVRWYNPHFDADFDKNNPGLYYVAHDSIEGIITYPGNTDVTPLDNPKSITVLSPNGGDKLVAGSQHKITWRHRELD